MCGQTTICSSIIHLLTTVRLFPPLGCCENAAVDVAVPIPVPAPGMSYVPRGGIAGSGGHSVFHFLRNLQTVVHVSCPFSHSHEMLTFLHGTWTVWGAALLRAGPLPSCGGLSTSILESGEDRGPSPWEDAHRPTVLPTASRHIRKGTPLRGGVWSQRGEQSAGWTRAPPSGHAHAVNNPHRRPGQPRPLTCGSAFVPLLEWRRSRGQHRSGNVCPANSVFLLCAKASRSGVLRSSAQVLRAGAGRPTPGLCPRDGSSGPSTGQPGFQGHEARKRHTGGRQG